MADPGQRSDLGSVSRRTVLKGIGGAALLSAVEIPHAERLGNGVAIREVAADPFPGLTRFRDYYDVGPWYHLAQTKKLPSLGYRLVSLSIYNFIDSVFPYSSIRYSAVWIWGSTLGPAQRFIQDVDEAGFWSANERLTGGHGAFALSALDSEPKFKPTIIAATTSNSGKNRFAAVFEETSELTHWMKLGLVRGAKTDPGAIEYWTLKARKDLTVPDLKSLPVDDRFRPTSLAVYGTKETPLFAAVWEPNPDALAWSIDGLTESAADLNERAVAQATAWNRPAHITLSPSGRYLSVFQDDEIGPTVELRELTKKEYTRDRGNLIKSGLFPLSVQAGGRGKSVRYAATFARQFEFGPVERRFDLRDSEDFERNAIDDAMNTAMVANGSRQAAVAVVHGTKLLFARGYTWSEPGSPLASATTFFRIGSCSKILTAITVMRLVQEGRMRLNDKIQDILELKTRAGAPPMDDRFKEVTICQALTHESGLRLGFDRGPEVAPPGAPLPATKQQIAEYHMGREGLMIASPRKLMCLAAPPSSPELCKECKERLSDFGYLLVSLVIEKVGSTSGESFAQIVRRVVGCPLQASRIRNGKNLVTDQEPDEARYRDNELVVARYFMDPTRQLVPQQYGGGDIGVMDAMGGLSMPVVDLARVVASLNMADNPVINVSSINSMLKHHIGWDPHDKLIPTSEGDYYRVKGGDLVGLSATVNYTQSDFAFVAFFASTGTNMRPDNFTYPDFPALQSAIGTVFTTPAARRDLFPEFGIPPC